MLVVLVTDATGSASAAIDDGGSGGSAAAAAAPHSRTQSELEQASQRYLMSGWDCRKLDIAIALPIHNFNHGRSVDR